MKAAQKMKTCSGGFFCVSKIIFLGNKIMFVYGNTTDEAVISSDQKVKYKDENEERALELQGSVFVSRMKSNGAFKRIKNNPHEKDGPIRSDVLILLTGSKTKKLYPKPIRKIKYYDAEYLDMQNRRRNNCLRSSDSTNDEDSPSFKKFHPGIMYYKTASAKNHLSSFWMGCYD